MKIRTAKDVELLDLRIKEELGVDVRKYRNEEVVETFVELLVFPDYVISWVIKPVLFSLGAFLLGFFLIDLVHIEYFIYAAVGFGLFLTTGVLFGLLFLTWKMKTDIWGIMEHALEILEHAAADINQVKFQMTAENRKEVLGLLFKGIIHIVTIPMLSKVIANKVPLIGGVVNGIVKKVLTLISDKVMFDEASLQKAVEPTVGEPDTPEVYSNVISFFSTGLEKIMNTTFLIAQIPIIIFFTMAAVILTLFIFLIN